MVDGLRRGSTRGVQSRHGLAGAEKDKRDGQASSRDQESVEHQDVTGYGALRLSWPQATQHRRGG